MAWTSVGFDGTITEIQWAGLSSLLGNGYVAAGNGDCLVTAVGGARQVSVAAGSLYGDGVLSTNSGAETVALTTPTNGQWYVIVLRRTWATNTAALVAIAGATTTTTTPTAPPTSFPTLNTDPGVLTDQPIAWAWCNSANTTVVVYDIRLKAVKSLPPVVATSAERDAKFMSPTQGLQVWRDDLGAVETYYGLYNVSTNPGGRDTAGWYTNDREDGLVPVKPTTVTVATGSGSVNSIGAVTVTGGTSIQLDGVFTDKYKNYRVFITGVTSVNASLNMRFVTGTTPNTSSNYLWGSHYFGAGSTGIGGYGSSVSYIRTNYCLTSSNTMVFDILGTRETNVFTTALGRTTYGDTSTLIYGTYNVQGTTFDGLYLITDAGNATIKVTIYGYNN